MKDVLYIIHLPFLAVGALVGTIWVGLKAGFNAAIEFWMEE